METGIIKAFPTPFLIEKIDSMVIDTPDFNSEHWKLDSVDNVIKYENEKLTEKIFELVSSFIQELGYVDQPLILNDNTGILIVKNPACDMIFSFVPDDMAFYGASLPDCTYKGKKLESQAKLYATEYHSWDKGYWHGSEGFFTFKKKL